VLARRDCDLEEVKALDVLLEYSPGPGASSFAGAKREEVPIAALPMLRLKVLVAVAAMPSVA